MYKVTFLLRYRQDLTREHVVSEWMGSHGELAMKLPGLRRYVQNDWATAPMGHEHIYDGSVDLWFDDEAAFNDSFVGPVGQAMLKDDLRLFDRSVEPAYVGGVVDEHVMLWSPGPELDAPASSPVATVTSEG